MMHIYIKKLNMYLFSIFYIVFIFNNVTIMIVIAEIDSELLFDAYLLCKTEFENISYEHFSKQNVAVYLDDGVVKGFIGWDEIFDCSIYISFFAVGEIYRKLGIGSALIVWLIEKYSKYIITLNVSVKNDNAIKLYKNVGFEIFRTIENYYTDEGSGIYTGEGRNSYVMCKISINI